MEKTAFILVFLMLAIFNGVAQPNGGFENWNTTFNYQEPSGWQTLNFLTITSPPNPMSASKASGIDVHSGNYALKIKTIHVNNNPLPAAINDTMGAVFTGKITISPPGYNYGFPYSQRPAMLEFWAKYIPVGGDTAGVRVFLRKWNGSGHDTIARGEMNIPPSASYSFFQLNLTYFFNELPDTAIIIFGSSRDRHIARQNSTLYVDDVTFTGWVGVNELNSNSKKVRVFPNPATDKITIEADIKDAESIQIIDVSGKILGVYKINNYSVTINTSLFSSGNYFYEIHSNKNSVIANGKFNVIK
jgi:hypothetical protein